ncbi:MAG: OmpA family protein [Acidobacteriota bacterium]
MNTKLLASLLLVGSGVIAAADPAVRGPDFVAAHPPSGVAKGLAASDGTAPIEPLDVIAFANGSATLLSSGDVQIDTAARWLHAHPGYKLVIEGHTDHAGSPEYNEDLATRRAEAVRQRLIHEGIASDRMVLVIFGEADATDDVNVNDRRAVVYATRLPTRTIVTASLDKRHAQVAVWTRKGTLFQEQNNPQRPREVIATRR